MNGLYRWAASIDRTLNVVGFCSVKVTLVTIG